MRFHHVGAVLWAALLFSGCSVKDESEATGDGETDVAAQDASPTVAAAEAPTPPQITPIQTQPGPEGRYVDLLRVSVSGDVMSVTMTYRSAPGDFSNGRRYHNAFRFPIEEVSAIDDATAQRLGVLKDDRGQWMASPLDDDPGRIEIASGAEDVQAWFKFPAPSANARTVSINVPGAGSFDAVPITR